MGKPKTGDDVIERIKELRRKGFSLSEIRNETKLGHGTVFRYLRGTKIDEECIHRWRQKRGGSVHRKNESTQKANVWSYNAISSLNYSEKLTFISALYWAEGSKSDLCLINSDPLMIKTFILGIQDLFQIPLDRIRISIRLFEDLDRSVALDFWSKVTGIAISEFKKIEVKKGHKNGKLAYGMCRVRILKGSDILKRLQASWIRFSDLLVTSPRSSTDRAAPS